MSRTRSKSIMIDPCHWRKKCPKCHKWFDIKVKPPGVTLTNDLPATYCTPCRNIISNADKKYHSIPEYLKRKRAAKKAGPKLKSIIKKDEKETPIQALNRNCNMNEFLRS